MHCLTCYYLVVMYVIVAYCVSFAHQHGSLRQGLWIFMIKPFNNDEIVDEFKQAKKF